jgi:hypothetical protein
MVSLKEFGYIAQGFSEYNFESVEIIICLSF